MNETHSMMFAAVASLLVLMAGCNDKTSLGDDSDDSLVLVIAADSSDAPPQ